MFVVVGRVHAGDDGVSEDENENDGARALDSTGAVIPAGYDAVVPVEDATAALPRDDGAAVPRVRVRPARLELVLSLAPRMWIRSVGCDVPLGGIVLATGETRLEDARVRRRPRVGNEVVVGTGDGPGRAGRDAFPTPTPRCCWRSCRRTARASPWTWASWRATRGTRPSPRGGGP